VAQRLRAAKTIALFLDFDGTLTGLRARPGDVSLNPATRRALLQLACRRRVKVWVISGRKLADVRERIRVPGIHYLGLHGAERDGHGLSGEAALTEPSRSSLRCALALLNQRLAGTPGLWVEDKGETFALHYRGATDSSIREARAALESVLEPLVDRLRVIEGDRVLEVLPREFTGKGVAARREWLTLTQAVPVYIGNDGTDEPAFAALASGITVRVGPACASRARFRLNNPAEVRTFLEKLAAEVF
jgi:trehalose 6-phosphate phosphatase